MPETHPTEEIPSGLLVRIECVKTVFDHLQLSKRIAVTVVVVQLTDAIELARGEGVI
ncbi:hypothetical protein D3C77_677850 [compost metagenome]